ncbi:hypothetical protein CVT24_013267 [Panaeolus cyanescens]|uniref:Uncharacterized protein n=1 Tax=Panaeolus cyanescens TaxID=181874 RepID=A0A409YP65_9AGAR|nr:hypothetical protein CVT24_013267 [Panaeolus cyanescens]
MPSDGGLFYYLVPDPDPVIEVRDHLMIEFDASYQETAFLCRNAAARKHALSRYIQSECLYVRKVTLSIVHNAEYHVVFTKKHINPMMNTLQGIFENITTIPALESLSLNYTNLTKLQPCGELLARLFYNIVFLGIHTRLQGIKKLSINLTSGYHHLPHLKAASSIIINMLKQPKLYPSLKSVCFNVGVKDRDAAGDDFQYQVARVDLILRLCSLITERGIANVTGDMIKL